MFYGDAALRAYPRSKESTRASLQIDGVNAYAPSAARSVESEIEGKGLPGLPTVSVTKTFDESTHQFTINEEDPIVKCAPENTYPPTKTSCTSFVSTGVSLVRSWQTTDESKLALMSDHFASIDGKEHGVDARYYMEMHSGYRRSRRRRPVPVPDAGRVRENRQRRQRDAAGRRPDPLQDEPVRRRTRATA